MKILLLGISKTKEKYIIQGVDKFKKLLGGFCNFSEKYLKESQIKDNDTLIIKEDSLMIMKNLPKGYYKILLDVSGTEISSDSFSLFLNKIALQSPKGIVFVIGGHLGFSEELKDEFDFRMCLSKMTLTHQMIRLFFVEQLYRAYSILNNRKYHK